MKAKTQKTKIDHILKLDKPITYYPLYFNYLSPSPIKITALGYSSEGHLEGMLDEDMTIWWVQEDLDVLLNCFANKKPSAARIAKQVSFYEKEIKDTKDEAMKNTIKHFIKSLKAKR